MMIIPKTFVNSLYIKDGPMQGQLAFPCICGYETDPDDPDVALIGWHDGRLMYVHLDCVGRPNA